VHNLWLHLNCDSIEGLLRNMIRAVFFDLDGTLYDRDLALRRMALQQHAMFKDEMVVDETTFVSKALALDAHGQPRPNRFHFRLVEVLGLREELAEKLESAFREHFLTHCKPPEDCIPTLQSLKSSGLKLAIITNGPVHWQMPKIQQCGFESFFDNILISEAEGISKPNPQIFERALLRCGVKASETIFVGDYPEYDIAGALAAGLTPVWKQKPYWSVASEIHRIEDLREILPLVSAVSN
jgi:putative hydrolase of the HAD superfamily